MAIDTSFVISFETCLFIDTKSCLYTRHVQRQCLYARHSYTNHVFMQDTSVPYRRVSLVGRHDLLKDMSSCLKMHFYCFYFLCFILLKTRLFPRHVLNMAPRHDFYSVSVRPFTATQRKVLQSAKFDLAMHMLLNLHFCQLKISTWIQGISKKTKQNKQKTKQKKTKLQL